MFWSADASGSAVTAGAGAVEIQFDMSPRRQYMITAGRAPLWFSVIVKGGGGASIQGSTSHYLAAGSTCRVAAIGKERSDNDGSANPNFRNRISIIRDTATDALGVVSELPTVQAQ